MPEVNPRKIFMSEIKERANLYKNDQVLQEALKTFHERIALTKYAYSFLWLGIPVIQLPQDMVAMQEIIWDIKPDLIIETGIAWGGSIVFSASMLALLEMCGLIENGQVIGVDIDIRQHNKKAIKKHPLSKKVIMYEGSSIDVAIVKKITQKAKHKKRILVCLDSNHTHNHVLAELNAYAPLVSIGSYCIVGDTAIDNVPGGTIPGRPWGVGNNPKTAVMEYLKNNSMFEIDKNIDSKLILTGSPDGYLKRIK